ncbi:MAG: DUF2922 domain-containing protein [Firmicutes bacterium]|jgi:hypothetical protein|nr:DUF2922 domain-containing protein [Bacillota bacterium]
MNQNLQLIFANAQGSSSTISIPDPKEELEPQEVENVMQMIIDRNIFATSGGDLVAAREARIVTRQVETILSF